jgi:hypothetical protein
VFFEPFLMWGDRLISEKTIRTDVFYPAIGKFPTVCQEYLKTSMTRLYFVADRIFEMTLEMYENPRKMVQDIIRLPSMSW